MPLLSPFQCLPQHIAESIGYYFTSPNHYSSYRSDYNDRERKKDAWIILFNVSFTWGVLAMKHMLSDVTLDLKCSILESGYTATNVAHDIKESYFEICPHVQTLALKIEDIIESPNATQLENLNKVWPEDLVFPATHTLRIVDSYVDRTNATGSAESDRYFTWIVQRMQTSLPKLHKIEIRWSSGRSFWVNARQMLSDERKAVLFLAATFRETRWSDNQVTDLEYSANLDLALQNSPNMVHIKFSPLNHSEYFYQLIKRSAYTIESIHAIESKSVLIMGLATGDDGSPIAFPNLKTLKLFNRFEEQHRIVIAGPVAPFMALQRLEISPDNLVDDDALAKISGSAFTCIDMSVDRETLDRLQKHKGFASRKFPQLCHFTVDEDCEPHFRLEPGHFLKYVFGLVAPATQHLEITLEDSYQLIYETIPTYPSLQHLYVLDLKRSYLHLREVLDVIKCLPNMTRFACRFIGYGQGLKKRRNKTIPDYLRSIYYPLSHRLKYWTMRYSPEAPINSVAITSVTIAVLCPSFISTDLTHNVDGYNKKLKELLASGLYDEHAEKISKLVYD